MGARFPSPPDVTYNLLGFTKFVKNAYSYLHKSKAGFLDIFTLELDKCG